MGNTENEIRKDKMGWWGVTETSLHFQLGKTKLYTPSINLSRQHKGQTEANDWSEFLMMLNYNV